MISFRNLKSLFDQLDAFLSERGERRELVIYGGAALISMGVTQRATVAIDVFQPKLDAILIEGIKKIAAKHSFGEQWINSTGKAFVKELPDGWKTRIVEYYRGKHLTIYCLGRIDMIFTKLLAELDRQEDMEDLKQLKPTKSELSSIQPYLIALEKSPEWQSKVVEMIAELGI